jgi:hypothetical protein
MFEDGAALAGTFSIAAVFVLAAGFMQVHREKRDSHLAQLLRVPAVMKSFLPGFSFASEVFLIAGLMNDEAMKGLGVAMLSFRLLHFFGALFLVAQIFGPESMAIQIGGEDIAQGIRKELNREFISTNIPPVGILILLSFCDVTMMQFLPFRHGEFYAKSKGYATMLLMRICLSIDCIQSSATAICQIIFLSTSSGVDDDTTSPEAKFLFIANILISVFGVAMGIILLLLKGTMLQQDQTEKRESIPDKSRSGDAVDLTLVTKSQLQSTEFQEEWGGEEVVERSDYTVNPLFLANATTPAVASPDLNEATDSFPSQGKDDTVTMDSLYEQIGKLTRENEGLRRRLVIDSSGENVDRIESGSGECGSDLTLAPQMMRRPSPPPPLPPPSSSSSSSSLSERDRRFAGFAKVSCKKNSLDRPRIDCSANAMCDTGV